MTGSHVLKDGQVWLAQVRMLCSMVVTAWSYDKYVEEGKEARGGLQDRNRKNNGELVYRHMRCKLYHILNSGEEQFNQVRLHSPVLSFYFDRVGRLLWMYQTKSQIITKNKFILISYSDYFNHYICI